MPDNLSQEELDFIEQNTTLKKTTSSKVANYLTSAWDVATAVPHLVSNILPITITDNIVTNYGHDVKDAKGNPVDTNRYMGSLGQRLKNRKEGKDDLANTCLGLMADQYAALLAPNRQPKERMSSFFPSSFYASDEEQDTLLSHLGNNAKVLTQKHLTELLTSPENPANKYETGIQTVLNSSLTDYAPKAPNDATEAALKEAQDLITTHHKETDTSAKISATFNEKIKTLSERIGTAQFGSSDKDESINAELNKLRSAMKTQTEALLGTQKNQSAQLFTVAIALNAHKIAQSTPDAAKKSFFEQDETLKSMTESSAQTALLDKAQKLIDALNKSGSLQLNALSVEGDTGTVISGEKTQAVRKEPLSQEEMTTLLEELKASEAKRIDTDITAQNKGLGDKLQHMAEEQHLKFARSMSTNYLLSKLSKQDAIKAQNFIGHSYANATKGSQIGVNALENYGKLETAEALAYVINDRKQPGPGISGPAWEITFKGDSKYDESKPAHENLKGTYSLQFSPHQSKFNQQQGIKHQAQLIGLTSDKITFTAHATYTDGGKTKTDRAATAEIAIMQAIAVYETSTLDPEKAIIEIQVGFDEKNKPVIQSCPLKDLENFISHDKAGNPNFRMSDYMSKKNRKLLQFFRSKEKRNENWQSVDKTHDDRKEHDSKHINPSPAQIFSETKKELAAAKTEENTTAPVSAGGGGPSASSRSAPTA